MSVLCDRAPPYSPFPEPPRVWHGITPFHIGESAPRFECRRSGTRTSATTAGPDRSNWLVSSRRGELRSVPHLPSVPSCRHKLGWVPQCELLFGRARNKLDGDGELLSLHRPLGRDLGRFQVRQC